MSLDCRYEYLVVGAGLFGAVWAREMSERGFRCLVIDRRKHIGGNTYTEAVDGINVHVYGPHIFHTSDETIWRYVNRFARFNDFINRPKINYQNQIYSFPINLMTLYQLWGVDTPEAARARLEKERIAIANPANLEEWALSQVGHEIYQKFIYGYTRKQWGREPRELPASIIKRLPIRYTWDDNYFSDTYQGIPIGGYTAMVERMLEGIEVRLDTDYLRHRRELDGLARCTVYTGCIDEFYDWQLGALEYRSLRFERERLPVGDYQGNAVVNYTEARVEFTRICEHKHFELVQGDNTVITREYPMKWQRGDEAYYPVGDDRNHRLYQAYRARAEQERRVLFGGRLGEYRYYDMHQVIGSALAKVEREVARRQSSRPDGSPR